jgi:ATP-dependent DNA helicase RecQ
MARLAEVELAYTTPERLERPEFLQALRARGVALMVVDEAHCVSQWGHDFRPAFLAVREAVKELGRPPILALTATATPEVLTDIQAQLGMCDAQLVNTGIERPSIRLEVCRTPRASDKIDHVVRLLGEVEGPAIVYAATIRLADEVHQQLVAQGIAAELYHGRLSPDARTLAQQRFMGDEARVMVATSAFGLGIDKPDIRLVVHYTFPDSLETYYQEAGRGGRDRKGARAVLLYRLEDRRIQTYFLGGKYPRRDQLAALLEILRALRGRAEGPCSLKRLVELAGVPERKLRVLLSMLEQSELVTRSKRGVKLVREPADGDELERLLDTYDERRDTDRDKLATIMRYAQTGGCRMRFIRAYFGEDEGEPCGRCDRCTLPGEGARTLEDAAQPVAKERSDQAAMERLVASAVGHADPAQLVGQVEAAQ